jgi:hypothetical protein
LKFKGGEMNAKSSILLGVALVMAVPLSAGGKKKNGPERAMLEKMEAVPCGAKQRGLTGLGSFWASVGVTSVNSNEKLCPQYLLRTDEMDYKVRPIDLKHAIILPVGHEVVFKIQKNHMMVQDPEGDKKMRSYEVVSMEQAKGDNPSAKASTPEP